MHYQDEQPVPMELVLEYCFNEFLKMCEFLNSGVGSEKKKFLEFVLYDFSLKIRDRPPERLIAQEKFKIPEEYKEPDGQTK